MSISAASIAGSSNGVSVTDNVTFHTNLLRAGVNDKF